MNNIMDKKVNYSQIKMIKNNLIKPHEKIRKKHANELFNKIKLDGFITNPIIVEKNTMILLDGHHRFYAIKQLGLSSSPVYLCRL
jgi:L-serine kinase (ADP)